VPASGSACRQMRVTPAWSAIDPGALPAVMVA
jgi:hypothetical protein